MWKIFHLRLHYSATDQKNKIFLLLSQQRLTVFNHEKNPRFLHQTRKFVQSIEGPCFLKRYKHNMKCILKISTLVIPACFWQESTLK